MTLATRIVVAAIMTSLMGFLTVQVWGFLRDSDNTKIALIAEAESYATRSRLVRQIDAVLDSLRDVHDYWETHSAMPVDGWQPYRGREVAGLQGLVRLLWVDEARGTRFLSTPQVPALDVPPSQEQWQALDHLLSEAAGVDGEAMLGPIESGNGHRIRVVINRAPDAGFMVAELDARAFLAGLLLEESQGYSMAVYWGEVTLFERGEAAVDIPDDWTREGMIRTSMDTVLRVVHAPTAELAAALVTPALAAVMPLGFAVSGLLGLLIFENGRVNIRADAARRAELQIAELNRGLERQVAERTEELASRNADLVTIAESVTHDLRSPLNAISVNLDVLEQSAGAVLDTDSREAIGRTASAVRRMAEILDRVMGLSLATHSTFRRQPLSMEAVVAEVFEKLQSVEPTPPATLELEPLPEVEADETLVRILVLNLLDNALRHTRSRDVRRIEVSASAAADGETVFCIRDNGCGLDALEARRIFAPFETTAPAGKSQRRGLGLVIAERIVKRHGGRIWADGIKGEGAEFHFTLGPEPE